MTILQVLLLAVFFLLYGVTRPFRRRGSLYRLNDADRYFQRDRPAGKGATPIAASPSHSDRRSNGPESAAEDTAVWFQSSSRGMSLLAYDFRHPKNEHAPPFIIPDDSVR